ncbi:ABC transporter substrate-binding protein [Nocardioides plantarum]|uniref:ABC transporter substrate-binding protein n=1 Tax=Nocardioides plantarum TaxID=29299 RepID=A0ABV5KGM7_9ACTN|nr:ABC transporter substrate-binding protein [Nocardioides plantarum]
MAALTAACGGGGSSDADDQITLGAWYPLSGPQAASGTPQEVGATVYFKQLNATGGIDGQKVKFITKDNAFDPQQTLQIARDLVARDKVDAIVATNGTATTEATFPFVLDQSKVPIFGTYGGSASWYDPPRDGLYGTQALYEDQAESAVDWAVEAGVKDLLVVRDDPDAFANVSTVAMEHGKKLGIDASEVVVKIGTTDYAPIVNQVKSKSPDGVLLILPPQEAAAYLNEVALQGVDVPAYGYSPAATESTIELAGKNAEGFRAVALTLPVNSDDPAVQEYRDAMKKYAPDSALDFYSLSAYASAKAFGEILKTIDGDITKESITAAIAKATDIETGVAPPFAFSADDHLGTDAVVRVEVKDGKYVAEGGFQSPQQ